MAVTGHPLPSARNPLRVRLGTRANKVKKSAKSRREAASWNPDILLQILQLN
jgi:hypothetical protein